MTNMCHVMTSGAKERMTKDMLNANKKTIKTRDYLKSKQSLIYLRLSIRTVFAGLFMFDITEETVLSSLSLGMVLEHLSQAHSCHYG